VTGVQTCALPISAAATGRTSSQSILEATSTCATHTFTIAFDPKRSATIKSGGRLAIVSFGTRWLATSGSCHRAAAPRAYRNNPLLESHHAATLSCTAPRAIKVHVNAIINGDGANNERIGNTVGVGVGEPLTTIASAVFKNKGDPLA